MAVPFLNCAAATMWGLAARLARLNLFVLALEGPIMEPAEHVGCISQLLGLKLELAGANEGDQIGADKHAAAIDRMRLPVEIAGE